MKNVLKTFSSVIQKINSLGFYLLNFDCHFFDILTFIDKKTKGLTNQEEHNSSYVLSLGTNFLL